ncbi:MAG: NAD-dependent epimerase/dehydratase family protein [Planctomycetes bacterium]|nr:NAD-dependent epimerase/dehydratase family protein [Planctomycetota bacterium]
MTTLVTGATGLLGNNVVRLLLERGDAVRVLARDSSDPRPLEGLDVERVAGDVRDAAAVRRACEGINLVIHAAARVHIGRRDLELQREINVEGTRHVAEAACDAGARLVHVSTVDVIGAGRRHQPADEETPPDPKARCTYVVTKREAEQLVLSMAGDRLDAVVVNPGYMLGPWDWKPSSGRMLLEVARRMTPLAPRGGSSVADVRDVARGVLLAAEKGERCRRYILAGENLTYFQQWKLFSQLGGSRPPLLLAGPLLRWIGAAYGDVRAAVRGTETDLNSAAVAMSSRFNFYSSQRAARELGYLFCTAREATLAAWEWFQEQGYVRR